MDTQTKQNKVYIDYKSIRELGKKIDCTIIGADFNTGAPNSARIKQTVNDINRYWKNARRQK